jgi:CxxC-x17-CxxC domain-containing protein
LEAVDEDKKNLVASGMMGVFKKIWPDVWSPRMEYILNNAILALLDYPGSTMLGVNRMMSDKDYRKRVYTKIKDPVVKAFWINEFDKWEDKFRKEAVAAIQNKVGQFLSYTLVRHIIGQPKSTIDMREIMDNQKILIINLSKGRIGEDAMRLLGGMIITKIQLAAMSRVEIPEEERKDFYLYVDEFQNFATESFSNILSEARKYRLALILAHQYINQLVIDGNSTVRDAIFGNVGTLISFRVGAEDAEHLEKEFDPVFLMNDIVNLSKFNIYLKLMIDGIAGDAFSATTLPPVGLSDTEGNLEKVINVSRERYGNSKQDVAEKIFRWSGMDIESAGDSYATSDNRRSSSDVPSTIVRPTVSESRPDVAARQVIQSAGRRENAPVYHEREAQPQMQGQAEMEKQWFDAVCDTCEKTISVPFKPDPKRKTFCKDCLKDYQRVKALQQAKQEPRPPVSNLNRSDNVVYDKTRINTDEVIKDKWANTSPAGLVSDSKTISLSQISNIMPKKFKQQPKNNPNINTQELRDMLSNTMNKKNE